MAAGDVVRWVGTDGNWSTGANWDSGTAPQSGEIAYFDGASQVSVTGGDESTAFKLAGLIVEPGYGGNIGSSGNPLIHNINPAATSKLTFRGRGDLYFQGGGAGVGQDNYWGTVDAKGSTVFLDGDANSSINHLYVKAGNVTVAGGLPGVLEVAGINANVTLSEHTTDPQHIKVVAGLLTSARTLVSTNIYIDGGKMIQTADIGSCNISVAPGGLYDYRPQTAATSGSTDLLLDGGLDYRNAKFVTPYNSFVIGLTGYTIGDAKSGFAAVPTTGQIDLRETYP